ncbi:hydrocephalus-inducing protein homolog [Passer domesticus]|uniref:hydrocephalus-inducing protein homolog n=1 Tax=Passer domesticus TaxID=48849 RepID=UPI0030FEF607
MCLHLLSWKGFGKGVKEGCQPGRDRSPVVLFAQVSKSSFDVFAADSSAGEGVHGELPLFPAGVAQGCVPHGASRRLCPCAIRFSPEENKDYSHELTCITTRGRIVVPIRAIAARAVLDFPEQLDFSRCPVKSSSQKTLLLRNSGNLEARFQLSTQSPFSMTPATGALGAGGTVQVTVGFHALTAGDHCGCLAVCCSTGKERIHTHLHGEAVDVNVGLSTNSVELDKTLITMSSHRTVCAPPRAGRESRLHLRGEGQGPVVELSCDTLDLGDIFVNTPPCL